MCPFCVGSAVLMASSVISTGGLTAALVRIVLRARRKEKLKIFSRY